MKKLWPATITAVGLSLVSPMLVLGAAQAQGVAQAGAAMGPKVTVSPSPSVPVTPPVTVPPSPPVSSVAPSVSITGTPTVVPTGTPTTVPTGSATAVPTGSATAAPTPWQPQAGVIFNEPRKPAESHTINRYIRGAIARTGKGQKIRMVTWNFNSGLYVNDLAAAHRRGVSVRIIMANGLSGNGMYGRLKKQLDQGNQKRDEDMTSWFKVCKNSCRGVEGIQHAKWFVFSRTGGHDHVVMSTSANLTDAAAYNQWNDLLTVMREKTYNQYLKIFDQMEADTRAKKPYYQFKDGPYIGWFNPQMKRVSKHNVVRMLGKVRCKGAEGDAGENGKTVIRVAQAVFNGKLGTAVAGKLRGLKNQGCKVKVVYGVLNRSSAAQLASIPRRYILEDINNDGFVDRYLHSKMLTISGVYDGSKRAHVTYQGSSNWSGMSTLSDEQGFIVRNAELEKAYSARIDYLFDNCPEQGLDLVKNIELRKKADADFDPFAKIRRELGLGKSRPIF